jgi:hypothetical protein
MTETLITIFLLTLTGIATLYLCCAVALLLSMLLSAPTWELIDMSDHATRRQFEQTTGIEIIPVIENISYVIRGN